MFCKYCGTPSETDVCPKCAAAQAQPQFQQPQQTQKPQQTNSFSAGDILPLIKKNLTYIIAGIAALALLFGLLNVFSVFHVNVSSDGESEYVSVSDVADLMEMADFTAVPIYLGNIIFGLLCLIAGAIGALYFLKSFKNMEYYDKYVAKRVKAPLRSMSILVTVGAILQTLLYLLCTLSVGRVLIFFGANWTTWLMVVICLGFALFNKFVLRKVEVAAPAEPAFDQFQM